MFRLVSLNLNGIRSAAAKGFEAWAEGVGADCMGVQEIKASAETIAGRFDTRRGHEGPLPLSPRRRATRASASTRAGGRPPCAWASATPPFDAEGRYVEARFDRAGRNRFPKLSIVSCYFPSGSSGEHRQQAKFRFLALMAPYLHALAAEREVILVGDINIAHKEIDLKNWKGNRKNSGFLPEERAWMTRLFEELGYVDVFRTLNPHPSSTPGGATAARRGRRTSAGASTTTWRRRPSRRSPGSEHIYLEQRFSDHAPLVIDYDFTL